jgi:putative tryptophan/tyrosine transport system substrate-binding protein
MGILAEANNPSNMLQRREVEAAAGKSGVNMTTIDVRAVDEIGAAIQTFVRERASIVVVLASPMFVSARRQIATFALASRLPTVYNFRERRGWRSDQLWHRPAPELPPRRLLCGQDFERREAGRSAGRVSDQVELVVNVTTAKAIGLTIPPTLLARADEVIE